MDRKLKNTIILIVILLAIIIVGSIYTFWIQSGSIEDRKKTVSDLNLNAFDTEELTYQLEALQLREQEMDSILSLRKFNIPVNLKQSRFFDFVNSVSYSFLPYSYVNIEYIDQKALEHYSYFTYRLTGVADFNDIYKLIYAIEQSKELKKITGISFSNFVKVDDDGEPYFLVDFNLTVSVYFSYDNFFAPKKLVENKLIPNPLYNIFYPLIRNEIPPNKDNLLDVQAASLLALIPDGAFISDEKGNTFLLWEGDKVYLGYLTEINYQTSTVHFVLNKGGIIEKITLSLENENKSRK